MQCDAFVQLLLSGFPGVLRLLLLLFILAVAFVLSDGASRHEGEAGFRAKLRHTLSPIELPMATRVLTLGCPQLGSGDVLNLRVRSQMLLACVWPSLQLDNHGVTKLTHTFDERYLRRVMWNFKTHGLGRDL